MHSAAKFGQDQVFAGLRPGQQIGSVSSGGAVYAINQHVYKFSRSGFYRVLLIFDTSSRIADHPYIRDRYTREEALFIEKCNQEPDIEDGALKLRIPRMLHYSTQTRESYVALDGTTMKLRVGDTVYWNAMTAEYNIMRQIDHPHVVMVHAHHVRLYRGRVEQMIIMERCDMDLDRWIERGQSDRALMEALFQTLYACCILWYQYGIVHHDLNLGNILVTNENPLSEYTIKDCHFKTEETPLIKLSDFGCAVRWRGAKILCRDAIRDVYEIPMPNYPCKLYDSAYVCRILEHDIPAAPIQCLQYMFGPEYSQYFVEEYRPKIPLSELVEPRDIITNSGAFDDIKLNKC